MYSDTTLGKEKGFPGDDREGRELSAKAKYICFDGRELRAR